MTVDANGIPLDSFVSQVRSTIQNDPLLVTIALVPLVFSLILLRRPKIQQKKKSGRLALIAISGASVAGFLFFILRPIPLSIFSTANFWVAFLGSTGVMIVLMYFMPGTLLEQRSPVSTKWTIAMILVALSPLAFTIVLLSLAGDTMFEKDFYTIAIIDGLLLGTIFGVSLGIAIKTLVKKVASTLY